MSLEKQVPEQQDTEPGESQQERLSHEYERLCRECDSSLLESAIHESGHVVAGRVFGRKCVAVSLDRAHDVWTPSVISAPGSGGPKSTITLRETLVILAAGGEAVRVHDPQAEPGDGDDEQRALSTVRELCGWVASGEELEAELKAASTRAVNLVREYWGNIVNTAAALIRHHETVQRIRVHDGPLEKFDHFNVF